MTIWVDEEGRLKLPKPGFRFSGIAIGFVGNGVLFGGDADRATFKVAVYGTLMAGERNERWAVDAQERKSRVLGWGYPAFIPNMDGGGVKAELLTITADTLTRMDILEGYPRLYRRETVLAVLGDGNIEVVMVYVMNKLPRRAMVIPSGDWRKFRAKKNQ